MDFSGFSSDEEERSISTLPNPPAQVPPDQSEDVLQDTITDQGLPQNSNGNIKGRGGYRGGGRYNLVLPDGCELVTRSGTESYICSCKQTFTEKKNLHRHREVCPEKSQSEQDEDVTSCKKRKLESMLTYYNEDIEGSKLLKCKL